MVPHTLTNSDLTRSPNNRGNSLLGQEGVISRRFFCLRIEGAPSALLLTVKRWNKLRRAIQSKPVGVLTRGECLLHDDAPPSTPPAGTAAVLQVRSIGPSITQPRPFTMPLPYARYFLFKLKESLVRQTWLPDDECVQDTMVIWLLSKTAAAGALIVGPNKSYFTFVSL